MHDFAWPIPYKIIVGMAKAHIREGLTFGLGCVRVVGKLEQDYAQERIPIWNVKLSDGCGWA